MSKQTFTRIAAAAAIILTGISMSGCEQITQDIRDGAAAMGTSVPSAGGGKAPSVDVPTIKLPKAQITSAKTALGTLSVKGKAPMTGYDRVAKFGSAWKDVDHNGCDTRNDILARDLSNLKYKDGTKHCVIASGTLNPEPYTGKRIDFVRGPKSSAVQIDHIVALGNVWVSGGQQLSQAQREAIANDPLNLVAADGPANMSKSDRNAAEWLPANKSYRCTYVSRQIQVKSKYHLSVTAPEKAAMTKVLGTC